MADDGRAPFEQQLIETLRLQAQTINNLVAQRFTQPPLLEPPEPKRHVPQNKEHRTWAGFRAEYQRLERAARDTGHMKADDPVSPQMLWEQGGPHPRTTERIMLETYGLVRRDFWPPSTWPEAQPQPAQSRAAKVKQTLKKHSHQIGLGLAAGWQSVALIEAGLDGHVGDGVLDACLRYLQHLVHAAPRLM